MSIDWLDGRSVVVVLGLVYGYIPYMILPLYAGLDRLPGSVLEAARDLGAGRVETFRRVTLPLSRPAIIASVLLTCLPMLGDYFTTDLLSGSPSTVDGRQPDQQHGARRPARPARPVRSCCWCWSSHWCRCCSTSAPRGPRGWTRDRAAPVAGPTRSGRPGILQAVTAAYLLWSLLPVAIAVMFSFNSGRSRTQWQGFSFRWYWGDPIRSVWHDDTLRTALTHTLVLGVLATAVTVPLGVAFALGSTAGAAGCRRAPTS